MNLPELNVLDSRWHLLLEIVLVGLVLAVALVSPLAKVSNTFSRIESAIIRVSDRPWLQAALIGGLAVILRAVLLPVLGPPVSYFPDDFSLVLQGQTFAMGRLSMPTHPLHHFFESYYVNHVPSYASMYFPGRGAPLALGIVLFGSPWAGVWVSMVALCMLVPWMLRAWVSKPLAFVGGILAVLKIGVLSGWINSYHGGAFAALGGVLVIGAYPRLMREPRWLDGLALGAGLFILMITRPFEGLLVSAPLLIALAIALIPRWHGREVWAAVKTAFPTALLTGAGLVLLLVTNAATTGDMLVAPYSHHRSTHAFAPAFLFQEPMIPSQSLAMPDSVTRYYKSEALEHANRGSLTGIAGKSFRTIKNMLQFYVGAVFALPFLIGLALIRKQKALLASGGLLSLGVLVTTWDFSQYWAPGYGIFMIAIMIGFGRMRKWRFRSLESGLFLSRALPCVAAAMTLIPSAALYAGAPRPAPEPFNRSCCAVHTQTPRSMIVKQLEAEPGRDLVLVNHREGELPFLTLVANEPDIDRAEIVWAHDLGEGNRRLLAYYSDRTVWRVGGTADSKAVIVRRGPG